MAIKWRFSPNNNAGEKGINDAGIETFSKNHINSLVRESLQNSIDAAKYVDDKTKTITKPVKVCFSLFKISPQDIPGYESLNSALGKCLIASENDLTAKEFFTRAKEVMDKKNIYVLRISDYNTTGLEGTEDPKNRDTKYYGLCKKEGASNNKSGSSGGSFGIGKNVYFGVSALRTVVFSSKNNGPLEHEATTGIAKLVSFEESKDSWTTGKGFLAENTEYEPFEGFLEIEPGYKRTTTGTDIYCFGIEGFKAEKIMELIERYVLVNFFVSILMGNLEVEIKSEIIGDRVINKQNIEKYILALNDNRDNEIKELKEYYTLLTDQEQINRFEIPLKKEAFGEKYGFEDGESTLYVRKSDGRKLNRKVLMTRKTGMRIFEKDNINGHIQFTGVAVIIGKNMNKVFREMEVPAHDAWEPGRCRGKEKEYEKIKKEFESYIRNTVNELIKEEHGPEVEAFGISDFIKDFKENPQNGGVQQQEGKQIDYRVAEVYIKEVDQNIKPKRQNYEKINVTESESGEVIKGKEHKSSAKLRSHHKDAKEDKAGKSKGYKNVEISVEMLLGTNVSNGEFLYKFRVPKNMSEAKLEFNVIGEQRSGSIKIEKAEIMSSNLKTKVARFTDNAIFLKDLLRNTVVKLAFKTNFKFNCSLEVKHYENK